MYAGLTKFIILAIIAVLIYLMFKKLAENKKQEFEEREN